MKKQNNRQVGTCYEESAIGYLEKLGYKIIEKNYRCPLGEIDIIAREGKYLCFIEVKYRSRKTYGEPVQAVNWKKQKRISLVASCYLMQHRYRDTTPVRFDVVGISKEEITLIRNAFSYWQH